jgi:hypothetical protein
VGAGIGRAYLVDAVTRSAEPLVTGRDSTDSPNYTTAIVPPRG